jgi:transposase InsO family protein
MFTCVRAGKKHPRHKIWRSPVCLNQWRTKSRLLRNVVIDRPNQTWCADITYIPMRRGFLYLVAIMDWYSRKVLAWRSTIVLGPMADIVLSKCRQRLSRKRNSTAVGGGVSLARHCGNEFPPAMGLTNG